VRSLARAAALVAISIGAAMTATSCAAALGIDDPGASLTELCQCASLSTPALADRCEELTRAKQNDVDFLRAYVDAGCPSCDELSSCLVLLGATANGGACTGDPDCASTHCCPDGACCTCHECRGPAPHCTTLFDDAAGCLYENHAAACASVCPGLPEHVDDACWSCLVDAESSEQHCASLVASCMAEPVP
jgi:hypothetical protein